MAATNKTLAQSNNGTEPLPPGETDALISSTLGFWPACVGLDLRRNDHPPLPGFLLCEAGC
jgi:hypothetical protein